MAKKTIRIVKPDDGYKICFCCNEKELPVFNLEFGNENRTQVFPMCDNCFTEVNMQIFEHLLRGE